MLRKRFSAGLLVVSLGVVGYGCSEATSTPPTQSFDFGAVQAEVIQGEADTVVTLRSASTGEVLATVNEDAAARSGRFVITGKGEWNVGGASAGELGRTQLSIDALTMAQNTYSIWIRSIDSFR